MEIDVRGVVDSSSCSRSKRRHKYDVFISFGGEDACKSFIDHLCAALRRNGLKTFRDDEDLERGEDIKPSLNNAIEESLCAVVVLSENYATSTWCLDELLKILHSNKELGLHIFPIFYGVDPSDVGHQRGSFAKAFEKQEHKFAHDKMKVQSWREALREVANIAGWNYKDYRYESKLIETVFQKVRSTLDDERPPLDSNDKEKEIMEKPAVSRKPMDNVWEHITVLERRRVRCNYCGVEFVGNANRIKCHIHQVNCWGIPPCTSFPQLSNTGSNKDKQDLDSQGPRDYNKLNERMLDCYMSPKTMWEGIKALQQVQMDTEAMLQEIIKVGPFYVTSIVNEPDLHLIQYVFEHSSDGSILFSSSHSFLGQSEFTTLRPQTHLDSLVIDIFAEILTDIERRKKSKPLNWYLPVVFSSVALNDDVSLLDFVKRQKIRENYMFNGLEHCEKIFIPVCVRKKSCGHYYLYIIHMKNQEVEVWDSVWDQFIDIIELDQTTRKLLFAMDRLFEDVMFIKFHWRMASNIVSQPNAYDSGIFVINYMQQLDKYVRKEPSFQFDSDEERLNLALKLLKSDLNQKKETLYKAATRRHYAQVKEFREIKRKRADTCKTISKEVGRVAYKELDDMDKMQFDRELKSLDLAVEPLLESDLKQEKEMLYDKAARKNCAQVKIEEDLELCGIKRKRVDTCKTISDEVGIGAYKKLDDFDDRVRRNNVSLKTGCSKGYFMPTNDLVGEKFQRHIQQIWKLILINDVSAVGIYGMGGAGKTVLATHVHNKLLEEAGDDFDYIIWVTVSQCDNSIYKLQKAIASSINLDISDERDVKRISGKLLQATKHINRCILILDDVWDPIFLEEVGFPISSNGIKLILTTRSWEVCQSMNCMNNIIEVKPLDEEECWDLFQKTLGMSQIQSSEVEPIARRVAKQMGGLPLAIVTLARSMKGKEDIREWNHLLECLQNLYNNGQYHMDKRVFPVLKSSYVCLNNRLRSFFLYYALSAEEDVDDSYVQPLIRRFFYEGWTDKTKNYEIQYDEGYTMLDELKKNSLLTEIDGRWRMHTLLRVMAINIAKKTDEIMAKPGMNLIELPENREWKENLHKVFLTESNIQKILDGTSPKCSKLSTLFLDCNYDLKWIPDDFFSNMPALKILDLSKTGIKRLSESVSNLECLIALLLSGCEELSYMPSLAKLQRLIELDLSFTAITEAPWGLELLVNLRNLNLACTDQLKMSSLAISKMTNLQSLKLMNWIPKSIDVSVQDLQGLRKLKILSVNFCDIEDFNAYVKSFLNNDRVLKSYCLSSATLFDSDSFVGALESCALKRVVLSGIDLTNRAAILPEDINELIISKCDHWTRSTCLCHALSFRKNDSDLPKIEWLQVSECDELEYLCCVTPTCLFCSSAQLGRRLSLIALKDLKQLVSTITPSLDSPFFYLRDLQICKCSRMKILMMLELLALLQNLETISVESCELMEEIVGENYSSGNTLNPTITLPKVRYVALHDLPELTFVFRGTMICPSLEYFHAYDCEKLSPPHIEIIEGCKLRMEMSTGYHWGFDN